MYTYVCLPNLHGADYRRHSTSASRSSRGVDRGCSIHAGGHRYKICSIFLEDPLACGSHWALQRPACHLDSISLRALVFIVCFKKILLRHLPSWVCGSSTRTSHNRNEQIVNVTPSRDQGAVPLLSSHPKGLLLTYVSARVPKERGNEKGRTAIVVDDDQQQRKRYRIDCESARKLDIGAQYRVVNFSVTAQS